MFTRIAAILLIASSAYAEIPALPAVAASQTAPKAEPFAALVPLVTKTVTDAEKLVRAPLPNDATSMQKEEETAKRKAALQALADGMAGKNVTGAFTVLDVVPDGRPNLVKVTGALAWKSKPIIDEESAKKIQELKDLVQAQRKWQTMEDWNAWKKNFQPKIDAAETEAKEKADKRVPQQLLTVYMYADHAKSWNKGQTKSISGYISKVTMKPVVNDGITYVQADMAITLTR